MNKILFDKNINARIKTLSREELNSLTSEIREFLIESVSKTGGHLASNLGMVEITLALHKVFDFRVDDVVFDVGHQSYVHKILTGRAKDFGKLRQNKGLAGFPKTNESEFDVFNSGHASNSISIGIGIAESKKLRNDKSKTIAVIGDGALTGGLSYEGLNNAGMSDANLLVVLNDNQISISKYTGSVANYLRRIRISKRYVVFKDRLKKILFAVPFLGKQIYKLLNSLRKYLRRKVSNDSIFENLGFTYFGPIDGHNLDDLIKTFNLSKKLKKPTVIHCVTQKGRGYKYAEKDPAKYHGVKPFDVTTGDFKDNNSQTSWSNHFGDLIVELGKRNSEIVTVVAAMENGTGLEKFKAEYPNRFFDVAIAEGHAVSFASGLAIKGIHPFVCIYSTFLQRAYDNILMDVCLMNLPVTFIVDRAGLVGEDGETHQGIFDIAYLSHMPNLEILMPSNKDKLSQALEYASHANSPVVIRIPKGNVTEIEPKRNENFDVLIISMGRMLGVANEISDMLGGDNITADVFDVFKIKPLPEELFEKIQKANLVISIEDNVYRGSLSEHIKAICFDKKIKKEIISFTLPDKFIEQGTVLELDKDYGLDKESIYKKIKEHYGK